MNTTWKPLDNLQRIKSEIVKAHLSQPQIRSIEPDKLYNGLEQLLLSIAQKKSIQTGKIEIQDGMNFICKYFKDFTMLEIKMAFEFESAGLLKLPDNFGAYGVFSLDYIGGVLKAARIYRIEETRKENLKMESEKKELSKTETKELNRQAMAQGVLEAWKFYNESKQMQYEPIMDIMGSFYYDYLRHIELIEKPTDEEMKPIKQEAETYLKNEIRNRQLNANRSDLKTLANELNNVHQAHNFKNTCKKIAIRVYFENLVLAEQDLQELLIKATTK